jgi:anti-anti-sigma regulatory factor
VSRTAVNERNGGRTQLVSVMASMTMLVVLLVATPLIRFLPVPVLTAIVVNALIGATEFGIARRLWRVNRVELGIFTGAFFGVLLLGAIKGVLVGMVLSFIDVLMRAAAPQRTFLGTLPGKAGFFPIDRVSGVQALPHIMLYRFSGSLFFANIRRFQEDIEGAVQPDTQAVIVDGSAIVSVDITACDRLVVLNRKLRAQGVRFYLTEHIGEVNDQLRHFEAGELIESGVVRRTIQGALRDADAAVDIGGAQQRIPDNMDDIRQLQELEWLYGADAEVQIERNVQLLLARMRTTEDKDARRTMLEHFLNEDFHFGSIDTDEVLLHLEGHTDELAALLGNSEDDVFTDLEAERDSLIDRVEQEHPEFVEHVRERRDHLDHDFRANHPTSAARIEARRTQLHARIEHERAERSARRAQHQAELSERHEQHMAAYQERHEQHATEQQLRHEQQLEARLRRQAEKQVAREQRQAAELARKAQYAAEKAQRHAQHAAERAQRQADHLAEKAQRHADHADERAQRHAERADARGHREDDRD